MGSHLLTTKRSDVFSLSLRFVLFYPSMFVLFYPSTVVWYNNTHSDRAATHTTRSFIQMPPLTHSLPPYPHSPPSLSQMSKAPVLMSKSAAESMAVDSKTVIKHEPALPRGGYTLLKGNVGDNTDAAFSAGAKLFGMYLDDTRFQSGEGCVDMLSRKDLVAEFERLAYDRVCLSVIGLFGRATADGKLRFRSGADGNDQDDPLSVEEFYGILCDVCTDKSTGTLDPFAHVYVLVDSGCGSTWVATAREKGWNNITIHSVNSPPARYAVDTHFAETTARWFAGRFKDEREAKALLKDFPSFYTSAPISTGSGRHFPDHTKTLDALFNRGCMLEFPSEQTASALREKVNELQKENAALKRELAAIKGSSK